METLSLPATRALRPAWDKGRIVGQKRSLKPRHVWAIRVRLELAENDRDLALFHMAIDSKLPGTWASNLKTRSQSLRPLKSDDFGPSRLTAQTCF